jgi:2-hydroxychromene-2-carboxylate isomerase
MGTDTRDLAGSDAGVGIELRYAEFTRLFQLLGCESLEAIAREIGMTSRTIRRARDDRRIGQDFVANTLAALRRGGVPASFEDVFEINGKAA